MSRSGVRRGFVSWIQFTVTMCLGALGLLAFAAPAAAQRFASDTLGTAAGKSPTAELLCDVSLDQHLDVQLPLDAMFRDENGRSVKLGDYFGRQPVVVLLVYYRCPMLCTQVLNGFLHSSQAIPLEIGGDYQVVTISIDPRETPELAAEKKTRYTKAYRRNASGAGAGNSAAEGWHFLTGDEASIRQVSEAIGFRYRFDPESDQFAHASGIVLATPEGKLARYLYGIEYAPNDLRFGLIESGSGSIGSPVDQILLLCYHYNPLTGKYGLAIARLLRGTGILFLVGLGTFLTVMYRHECRRTRQARVMQAELELENELDPRQLKTAEPG